MDHQQRPSQSDAVARAVREVRDALAQEREGVCVDPPPRQPKAAASVLDETHLDVRLVGEVDQEPPTPNELIENCLAVMSVLALGIGGIAVVRKAERTGTSMLSHAGRQFMGNFVPPLVAGALLTPVLYGAGLRLMECLRLRVQDVVGMHRVAYHPHPNLPPSRGKGPIDAPPSGGSRGERL